MLRGKEFALNKKSILERLGIGLSILCAIHCMAMPLLLVILPVVSSEILHNHVIEFVLLGFSFSIVGYTNFIGLKKYHESWIPVLLMILAFLFIISGHILHSHILETVCSVIGGLLLAYSVYANQQQKKLAENRQCYCSKEH